MGQAETGEEVNKRQEEVAPDDGLWAYIAICPTLGRLYRENIAREP